MGRFFILKCRFRRECRLNSVDLLGLIAEAGDKHEALELGLLTFLPLLLAGVLYLVAESRVRSGAPMRLRWAAIVPLLFGAYLARVPLKDIGLESYRSFHNVSDRSAALHYASFFVPLGAAVLLAGWIIYQARRHQLEG